MLGLATLLLVALGVLILTLGLVLAWEMVHPPRRTAAYAVARGLPVDPADLGLTFETWTLDLARGAAMPIWEVTQTCSSATRAPDVTAILLHGWGHSRVHVLARVALFARHIASAVLVDLRGHGESIAKRSRLGDGEHNDVLELIERLGRRRVVLVGHSMGAVIALRAAADNHAAAARIAGVVAVAPYADFHTSLRGRLRAAGLPTWPMTAIALLVHRALGTRPPGAVAGIEQVRCPVLLIHGEQDAVAPIAHAHRLHARRPDIISLTTIPGASHLDVHEFNPALIQDAIDRWFESAIGRDVPPAALPSTMPVAPSSLHRRPIQTTAST